MIWRCFGRGIVATATGYLAAVLIGRFTLFDRWIAIALVPVFVLVVARWGASRSMTLKQGALHGALTMSVPAVFATLLFLLLQYEWGGPHVFNVDHIYASLILLGVPLLFGGAVGAVVGHRRVRKTTSPPSP